MDPSKGRGHPYGLFPQFERNFNPSWLAIFIVILFTNIFHCFPSKLV